jgi:hypothetical protein
VKNYLVMFLTAATLTIFSSSALAQNLTQTGSSPVPKTSVPKPLPKAIPSPANPNSPVAPATLKVRPNVADQTLMDLLVKEMKKDGVYNKNVGKYLAEFNRIFATIPDSKLRSKAFVKLDKQYPRTSVLVRNYFDKLINKPVPQEPIIYDIPPVTTDSPAFIALIKEMQGFVDDLIKVKTKLNALETKLDSYRN